MAALVKKNLLQPTHIAWHTGHEYSGVHRFHRCTRGGRGGRGAPHVPPIKIFEKLPQKNVIKHDSPPPDFLTTPSTPLKKKFAPKNPRTPPPLDFQLLCIYDSIRFEVLRQQDPGANPIKHILT